MHGILSCFKRLAGHGFQSLHYRFLAWTKPDTTSLLLGTLTDLTRNKSELVAENALLRQQLIIHRRLDSTTAAGGHGLWCGSEISHPR